MGETSTQNSVQQRSLQEQFLPQLPENCEPRTDAGSLRSSYHIHCNFNISSFRAIPCRDNRGNSTPDSPCLREYQISTLNRGSQAAELIVIPKASTRRYPTPKAVARHPHLKCKVGLTLAS